MIEYPLTTSHLRFAWEKWKCALRKGASAIDATCGRGKDTLRLARLLGPTERLIGIDIQREAIEATRQLLTLSLPAENLDQIHLFQQSHVQFPRLAYEIPISLIVYNLGYLPQGNHEFTTMTASTLESIREAMNLIKPQGLISVTCYPGHPEGKVEEKALIQLAENLPLAWGISFYRKPGSPTAPSLLFLQKP